MRLMVVGARSDALAHLLEKEGIDVSCLPHDALAGGEGEVGQIAAEMRAFEGLLSDGAVDGVAVWGSSNPALAAVLVATKLRVPVAAIEGRGDGNDRASQLNRRLIDQLADAAVADHAAAIAAWLRGACDRGG